MRREEDVDVLYALPVVFKQAEGKIPWTAIFLLVATILSVFYTGAQSELYVPVTAAFSFRLTGNIPAGMDPTLLPTPAQFNDAIRLGTLYTLSLLGILGAHEMGHYIMARRHKVNTTLPFFIPLPISILGTMGAVIAMREPSPNRKVQFDIGVAGPLAGLILTIPILFIGISLSEVGTPEQFLQEAPAAVRDQLVVFQEGNSLIYLAVKYIVTGRILPSNGEDVWIHPVAFAGWAGLLVTALNLIPVGQLDGGHIVYGLFGKTASKFRRPVLIVMVLMALVGTFQLFIAGLPPEQVQTLGVENYQRLLWVANLPLPGWNGWWIWVLMIFFLVRTHAPVLDEITNLDTARRGLGIAMLIIFVLIFTPQPLVITPLAALLAGRELVQGAVH
jgi:membrane-associated protease RseP (regulator of RpoE activity)